jgi:hypothetical protein
LENRFEFYNLDELPEFAEVPDVPDVPEVVELPSLSHLLQNGKHFPNKRAQRDATFLLMQYEAKIKNPCSGVVNEKITRKIVPRTAPALVLVSKSVMMNPKIHERPIEMKIER